AGRCMTTLPPSPGDCPDESRGNLAYRGSAYYFASFSALEPETKNPGAAGVFQKDGAGNETRTRDPNLGKVVLYQLSYSRFEAAYFSGSRMAVKSRSFRAGFITQPGACRAQVT